MKHFSLLSDALTVRAYFVIFVHFLMFFGGGAQFSAHLVSKINNTLVKKIDTINIGHVNIIHCPHFVERTWSFRPLVQIWWSSENLRQNCKGKLFLSLSDQYFGPWIRNFQESYNLNYGVQIPNFFF